MNGFPRLCLVRSLTWTLWLMLIGILAACTVSAPPGGPPQFAAIRVVMDNNYPLEPYLLGGAVAELLIILVLVIFVRTLRDRVRQQSHELEAALAGLQGSEQQLRHNRRFLADLIEYSGALVFVKDREGRYELINRKWEEVTGWSRDAVIGRTDEDLFPGPIGQQFRANDLEVIETGRLLEREEVLEDAQGKRFFISIKFPLRDEEGRITGICGMTTEITARKQADEALRASESRLRTVTENAPDTILLVDQQGTIQFINRPVPGLTAEQIIGTSVYQWVPDYQYPVLTRTLEAVFTTRQRQEYESLGPGPYGESRTYHVRIMPVIVDGQTDSAVYIATDISERKQAEEAVRAVNETLQAIIDVSPLAIVLLDLNENVQMWNTAAERIFGWTTAEVVGLPTPLVPPAYRDQYEALKAKVLQDESILGLETTRLRKDGSLVDISLSTALLHDAAGQPRARMAIITDITAHKQSEEALRESEERLRALIDNAPYGAHLYQLEPDNRLVFIGANHSADVMLHVDHRQFVGKTIEEAFPPLIETEIPAAYRRVAVSGERYQLEQISYDADGIRGVYEIHAFQTGTNRMAVFFRDITERKQAEDALRESEERYQNFVSQSFEGISRTEFNQPIDITLPVETQIDLIYENAYMAECNQALAAMYGLPSAEAIIGVRLIDAHHGKDNPVNRAAFRRLIENGYKTTGDETLEYRADGEPVWFLSNTVGTVENGYLIRLWGTALDITERKRTEAEIKQLNQDLERRVADRTRELAAANERLTELDQLKSKFVSDVSHELRTPIAILKMYFDLLERGKPEKRAQYLTVLHQQMKRVSALVDDILDLSRLERWQQQGLSLVAVQLNKVAAQVVMAYQPRAEAEGVALTFEPMPDLPLVYGDANQLAQVVTNLVVNALNYTSSGYVRVSTRLGDARTGFDARIGLVVADSGSGIAAEDLPYVFERFYRGRRLLKHEVPGTGLGLSIVKEIVDLHQGQIEVESRPGEGTTFMVWLNGWSAYTIE